MQIGDRVKCIRSESESLYSVGTIYEVEGLAGVDNMLLRDNHGDLDPVPIPMKGLSGISNLLMKRSKRKLLLRSSKYHRKTLKKVA